MKILLLLLITISSYSQSLLGDSREDCQRALRKRGTVESDMTTKGIIYDKVELLDGSQTTNACYYDYNFNCDLYLIIYPISDFQVVINTLNRNFIRLQNRTYYNDKDMSYWKLDVKETIIVLSNYY
jgi:hypothetical protein